MKRYIIKHKDGTIDVLASTLDMSEQIRIWAWSGSVAHRINLLQFYIARVYKFCSRK